MFIIISKDIGNYTKWKFCIIWGKDIQEINGI